MPADGEGAQDRLQRYAWSLDGRSETALRVVNAIALHNARDLLRDYRQMGDLVWDRFHPLPSGTVQLWYLGLLRGEFWKLRSRYPLAREFHDTVDELKREMDKRVRYQAIFVDSTARSVFRNVGLYYEGFNPIERRWLGSPVACDMFCGVDLSGNDVDELEALEIARALMTKIANAQ